MPQKSELTVDGKVVWVCLNKIILVDFLVIHKSSLIHTGIELVCIYLSMLSKTVIAWDPARGTFGETWSPDEMYGKAQYTLEVNTIISVLLTSDFTTFYVSGLSSLECQTQIQYWLSVGSA